MVDSRLTAQERRDILAKFRNHIDMLEELTCDREWHSDAYAFANEDGWDEVEHLGDKLVKVHDKLSYYADKDDKWKASHIQ